MSDLGTAEHVQEVARRATAHNYGQTVWGIHRIGDCRWVLRMSSWPRAQEAAMALRAAGYTAEDCGACSLDVACPGAPRE